MVNKSMLWAATLVALIALIFIIIAIIVIRKTWDDPQAREAGAVWLYVAAGAIFVTALMVAISAELTPNTCKLPYSGTIITTDQIRQ